MHTKQPPSEYPRISLLHATRGRVSGATDARNIWLAAAEFPERVEHIFAFDRDDTASVSGLSNYRHVIVEERDKGCVAAWNLAARASKGQILVQLSDDWLPIRHWDSRIYARFRSSAAPGVLRVSDCRRVDDLLAFAIFNRAYLNMLEGDFLAPEYFGVYSDDEFSFRAYQRGLVIDARDIVFEHRHPSFFSEAAYDETHRRQNDDARYQEGRKIFLRRNPSARGHWLHEGTEERFYLPPGHRFVQNNIGPVHLAPSPLGRQLPPASASYEPGMLQLGKRGGQKAQVSIGRKVAAIVRWFSRLFADASPQLVHRSTLWEDTKGTADTADRHAVHGHSIPVFIISYNQPSYLRNMVNQLQRLRVAASEITILDNASSNPQLMEYLEELRLTGIRVVHLERNFGPHEIFAPEAGVDWPEVFALTDPDLQFDSSMPTTFREDLLAIACACCVWKCGLALSLEDADQFLEGVYVRGMPIADWESQFWHHRVKAEGDVADLLTRESAEVFRAEVDTTFAIYRRDYPKTSFLQSVRVSGNYSARHLPWYRNQDLDRSNHGKHDHAWPDANEEDFYAESASHHATSASARRKP
jgi:hypothetical protein